MSAAEARRQRGVYYTPAPLVEYVLRLTLDPRLADRIAPLPTVLDPACGEGAFLVPAYRRLLAHAEAATQRPLSPNARLRLLRDHIYGVDIDPAAVAAARDALVGAAVGADEATVDLSASLVAADALSLDWAAAFPAPMARGGFDVIVGNPPWLAAYARVSRRLDAATKSAWRARYGALVGGRLNTYTLFLALALELRAPNGVLALLVPDTLATNTTYAPLRATLVQAGLRGVDRLDFPAFGQAAVRAVVPMVAPSELLPRLRVFPSLAAVDASQPSFDVTVALDAAGAPWPFSPPNVQAILRRMEASCMPLGSVAEVRDGVNPGPREARERLLNPAGPPRATWRPLIGGGHVTAYAVAATDQTIDYDPALLTPAWRQQGASLRRPEVFAAPKIVSRQTANTLVAALDEDGVVALNSVHCTHALDGRREILLALLALLNSRALRFYYRHTSHETRDVFPQVHIAALRQLPVPRLLAASLNGTPTSTDETQGPAPTIAALAERLVGVCRAAVAASPHERGPLPEAALDLQRAIDDAVYRLYGLTSDDRAVIEADVGEPFWGTLPINARASQPACPSRP